MGCHCVRGDVGVVEFVTGASGLRGAAGGQGIPLNPKRRSPHP